MSVPSLPRDWLSVPFLQLLFQNLIVEERSDTREATLAAWRMLLSILSTKPGWLQSIITQPLLFQWYDAMMTPLGTPINVATFYDPVLAKAASDQGAERHNVDKNMIAQDLSLIPMETIVSARIAAAVSTAYIMAVWPDVVRSLFTQVNVTLSNASPG
jgi:TATA-binding protein-associated factor